LNKLLRIKDEDIEVKIVNGHMCVVIETNDHYDETLAKKIKLHILISQAISLSLVDGIRNEKEKIKLLMEDLRFCDYGNVQLFLESYVYKLEKLLEAEESLSLFDSEYSPDQFILRPDASVKVEENDE